MELSVSSNRAASPLLVPTTSSEPSGLSAAAAMVPSTSIHDDCRVLPLDAVTDTWNLSPSEVTDSRPAESDDDV